MTRTASASPVRAKRAPRTDSRSRTVSSRPVPAKQRQSTHLVESPGARRFGDAVRGEGFSRWALRWLGCIVIALAIVSLASRTAGYDDPWFLVLTATPALVVAFFSPRVAILTLWRLAIVWVLAVTSAAASAVLICGLSWYLHQTLVVEVLAVRGGDPASLTAGATRLNRWIGTGLGRRRVR